MDKDVEIRYLKSLVDNDKEFEKENLQLKEKKIYYNLVIN